MIARELAFAVWVSLKTSGLAALIASAVAVPAALFLSSREFRGKGGRPLFEPLAATPGVDLVK